MSFYDHYFKENESHDYSCVRVNVPNDISQKVTALSNQIEDKFIYDNKDDSGMGRVDEIHVTVLDKILTQNPSVISHAVKDFGPFDMEFGSIKIFEGEIYDTLIIDVKCERLVQMNKVLRNLDHQSSYEYMPHCTIAYVKNSFNKEMMKKIDKDTLKGIKVRVTELNFYSQNGSTIIPLLYRGSENRDDQILEPKSGHTKSLDEPLTDPRITLDGKYGENNVTMPKGIADVAGFGFAMIDK